MLTRGKVGAGQSLLEIIIAIGIAIVIVIAITIITTQGLYNSQLSKNQLQATKYAQEGLEKLRSFKETNTPFDSSGTLLYWYNLTPQIWVPTISTLCSSCNFMFQSCSVSSICPTGSKLTRFNPATSDGESLQGGLFYRKILIDDSLSPNQKKFISIVSWGDFVGGHESQLETVLANY